MIFDQNKLQTLVHAYTQQNLSRIWGCAGITALAEDSLNMVFTDSNGEISVNGMAALLDLILASLQGNIQNEVGSEAYLISLPTITIDGHTITVTVGFTVVTVQDFEA